MDQTLGTVIRTRRMEMGWTQEDLAKRVDGGIRQSEISRLETGHVALPRHERLECIARALGLPVGELLELAGWDGANDAFASEVNRQDHPDLSREQPGTQRPTRLLWGD
jgi:transcriptional regulator with XRE-family HTH domain